MLHIFLIGFLLGLGAAIPIGPINLEIIRRNLQFGTRFGLIFGMGACSADFVYLILLSIGALLFLTYPLTLKIVGVIGALILLWFGYSALRMQSATNSNEALLVKTNLAKQYFSGLMLTLFNPFTIIFWSSISAQVANLTHAQTQAIIFAGLGVLFGALSWEISLNTLLHFTKHRLSPRMMSLLNKTGGIILLGFAGFGFYHALII